MPGAHGNMKSRRLTVAGLIVVTAGTLLMMAWAVFPSAAFADGIVTWTGNGSEHNEPCEEGETPGFHWVFTTGGGAVTDADLTVNGIGPIQMSPNPNMTQWDADVVSGVVVSASVAYTGTIGNNAVLTISHGCASTQTSSTTQTTTSSTTQTTTSSTTQTTTSGTTSTGTTTSGTTSVGPTTVTPTRDDETTTEEETVSPTTVTPGGVAFTGPENVVPLGVLALTLLTSGSGLLWAGARRRRSDEQE